MLGRLQLSMPLSRHSAATQELPARVNAASAKPPPPPSGATAATFGLHATDRSGARRARQNDLGGALATVAIEERQRAEADQHNAHLLGYDAALGPSAGGFGAVENHRADLIAALEEPRYFIVLMACDFEGLWKHRRHTLLWATRISVRSQARRFDAGVPAIMDGAAR